MNKLSIGMPYFSVVLRIFYWSFMSPTPLPLIILRMFGRWCGYYAGNGSTTFGPA
jgi:hypothetical protein